jgi:hypothetical protein
MRYRLIKLSEHLESIGNRRIAKLVFKLANDISEDWDVDAEEERLLSLLPETPDDDIQKKEISVQEVDKIVRDTQTGRGWYLPGEEGPTEGSTPKEEADLVRHFNEIIDRKRSGKNKRMSPEEMTSELITSIKSAGDGRVPEYVGSGVWGVVWNIGNDRYLKVYDFSTEHEKAELTRGMVFEKTPFAESELMVHSYGALTKPTQKGFRHKGWKIMERLRGEKYMIEKNDNLYYVFSNLVTMLRSDTLNNAYRDDPISEKIAEIKKFVLGNSNWDIYDEDENIIAALRIPENIESINRAVKRTREKADHHLGIRDNKDFNEKMIDAFDLNQNWMNKLIEHMHILYISGRSDSHMGNIGIRPSTGTFVFFDA